MKGRNIVMNPLMRVSTAIASTLLLVAVISGQTAKPKVAPTSASAPPSSERIVIQPNGLPKPFHTESVRNPPKVVPQPDGAKLAVPPGFDLSVFSEGDYRMPRWVIEGPNGDLFLADSESGPQGNRIYLLRDQNKDGRIDNATERFTFVTGLNRPFGMAIQKVGEQTYFYVGNTDSVVRFKYTVGQTKLEGAPEKLFEIPTGGHWTRDILFSRDGKKMYVSVGSGSNVNE